MLRIFAFLFTLCSLSTFAQSRVLLAPPLNSKGGQEYYPSLSGDGKTMVFQSKLGDAHEPEFMISYMRSGTWTKPELLSTINTAIKTVYTGDLTISHDGNSIAFTSAKYGGIGFSDIWISEKKGGVWQAATNVGKPINTLGQEGDPALSPDNKFLYFIRYTGTKTPGGIPCGKIYKAEKIAGTATWKEPVALPAPINQTCECNPRIMADGKTLFFASVRAGGKGEYDQYVSKLNDNGTWSSPKALVFINTPQDDRYISVTAQGNTVFYTVNEKGVIDIASSLLPTEFQPDQVVYWKGSVKDATTKKPLSARIVITDKKTNKLNIIQSNADGTYHVFLPEGNTYDVAVQSNEKGKLYYSTLFEIESMDKYQEIEQLIELLPATSKASMVLNNIRFEPESATLTSFSTPELNRIISLLKENPNIRVEIGVHTDLVKEDSIKTVGLTEVTIDTLSTITNDSTGVTTYLTKNTYHNDRTPKQAQAIANYIVSKGIPASRFSIKGYGDKKPLNPVPSDPLLNKRVELIVQ